MKIQEAFKQGKKIRRESWNEGNYIYVDKTGVIKNNFNEDVKLNFLTTLNADDWEVFKEVIKEEFNLSNHLEYATATNLSWGDRVIRERYVKEFIRLLKERTTKFDFMDLYQGRFLKEIENLAGGLLIGLKDFDELVEDKLRTLRTNLKELK